MARGSRLRWLVIRARLIAAAGVCALLGRCAVSKPPPASVEGTATMLGRAVSGEVAPADFVWEPSNGWLHDALLGRQVVFVATSSGPAGAQRDVFRASVRVTREGRPLGVVIARNLSDTSLADEGPLVIGAEQVAFVSHSGGITGVTGLALNVACRECGFGRRLHVAAANWLAHAAPRGISRVRVAFGRPPPEVRVGFLGANLDVACGEDFARVSLWGERPELHGPNRYRAEAWWEPSSAEPLDERLADGLARAGRALMARVAANGSNATPATTPSSAKLPATSSASTTAGPARSWPPAGAVWSRVSFAGHDAAAEAALYQSTVRPAPGVEVQLVAIDTRQLELRLQAGYRQPHAATGPGGSGQLPEADRRRIVAILGARGGGGMSLDRRVLVPAVADRPTVAVDRVGHALVGRWREPSLPEAIAASRQSAELPAGRVDRAGLCRTEHGQLVYAFARDLTAAAIDRAFELAGCVAVVPLGASARPFQVEPGEPEPSADDFFYLVAREPKPPTKGRLRFEPADGEQPPPTWLPAIYRSAIQREGATITVWSFAPGRFDWRIVPGRTDDRARTAESALEPAEQARALVAIGLGASDPDNHRGLSAGGALLQPFHDDHAALLGGELSLALAVRGMAPDDAAELVLLAEAGVLRSEARIIGPPRVRSAMCMLADGTLLYAEGTFDNPKPLAEELLEAGCRRVADSDRGRQPAAFIDRAGTPRPPEPEYHDTVLFAFAHPALGTARDL